MHRPYSQHHDDRSGKGKKDICKGVRAGITECRDSTAKDERRESTLRQAQGDIVMVTMDACR